MPALIGDFLITDQQLESGHLWLPTQPNINDPKYPKLPRRISGIRRKLHLVNEKFLVAFTGDVKAGAAIFSDLERRFGKEKRGPSVAQISKALQGFTIQFWRRATIIGWTVGPNPRCFKWSAQPGASAIPVTHAIEGTGSRHFTTLLNEPTIAGGYSSEVRTAFERAILLGLTKTGAVLFEELRTGANLTESYGYGAEIVLFTGGRFRFVSRLGYVFWNALINLDGSVTIIPSNVVAAYEARGRYCVLQVTHLDLRVNPIRATDTYLQAIIPLHDEMSNLSLPQADEISPVCEYYFNGIVVQDRRSNLTYLLKSSFIMSATSPFRIQRRDGLYFFEWDREQLEHMIKTGAGR